MTEKIDLSLDDIIKANKKKGGPRNSKPGSSNINAKAARSKIRPKIQPQQSKPRQQQQQSRDNGPTMLHIANLHFNVSDKDLKELFEEIGRIKKAAIHYDKSGRSIGTAEVVFWARDDAIRAIKEYNQRILDGRPMNITLVPSRTNINNISTSNSRSGMGLKKGSGIQKRSPPKVSSRLNRSSDRSPRKGGNKGGPRRQGKPGGRQPKKEVSAEQLDKELEAYTSSKMNVD